MRYAKLLLGLLAVLAAGCTAVMSTRPIGDEPLVLLPEEWEGTWTDSEDFLEIRVIDAEAGRLEAAWIEIGDSGFRLERIAVFLRQTGETVIASVLELDDGSGDGGEAEGDYVEQYAFVRLAREGGKLLLWDPDVEAFKALVEAGTLPGTVTEGGDVVLEALSSEQLALIVADESAGLWDWQHPGVLLRSGNG